MRAPAPQRAPLGLARRRRCRSRVRSAAPRRLASLVRKRPRSAPRRAGARGPNAIPGVRRGSRGSGTRPTAAARHKVSLDRGRANLRARGRSIRLCSGSPPVEVSSPPREPRRRVGRRGSSFVRAGRFATSTDRAPLVTQRQGKGRKTCGVARAPAENDGHSFPAHGSRGGSSSMGEALASEVPARRHGPAFGAAGPSPEVEANTDAPATSIGAPRRRSPWRSSLPWSPPTVRWHTASTAP